VHNLLVAKSNKRLNRVHKGTLPTHLSYQNNVRDPSPTLFDTLSANQPPFASHIPSLILTNSLHQKETLWPPASNLPASSPYRTANTLYQNPFLSTNIRQHHLPNKALLNSLVCLTPNPPYSFCKHIELQAIQEIFLFSSLPKKIN